MVRVAVIGASGYTGAESVEILLRHSKAELVYLAALPQECGPLSDIFPRFRGRCDLKVEPLDVNKIASLADVVLCCLPHKISMGFVGRLLEKNIKVVDFSADYRLKDTAVYRRFYGVEHTDAGNLERAVFGLPELYRDGIRNACLVANPGCFPTAAILALAPLLKHGMVDTGQVIVNAVTGVSGAGRSPSPAFHFPNMNENIFAYGIGCHRHLPEIKQIAGEIAGCPVDVLFQPHAGPFDRGILATVYCKPKGPVDLEGIHHVFRDFYRTEPFVRLCDGSPAVKNLAGTNYCHVFPTLVNQTVVVFSAIDNLVKGASGQAVQNMNIMFGLEETLGLK